MIFFSAPTSLHRADLNTCWLGSPFNFEREGPAKPNQLENEYHFHLRPAMGLRNFLIKSTAIVCQALCFEITRRLDRLGQAHAGWDEIVMSSENRVLPMLLVLVAAVMSVSALALAGPAAQSVAKKGSCPSGYSTSGAYCKPNSGARFAVAKVGSCPSGYSTSGDYCLANADSSRHAVPRSSSCPSGYSTSGDYCLAHSGENNEVKAAVLTATALPKKGSCPSRYSTSGDYCKPNSGARFAVVKVGSCPSGYSTSGDYCLASTDRARHSLIKEGSCPSGYSTSGDYCLAH